MADETNTQEGNTQSGDSGVAPDWKAKYDELNKESQQSHTVVQNLNDENQKYKTQLEAFKGIDPEEFSRLKQENANFKANNAKGKPEEVKALIEENVLEARKEMTGAIEERDSTIASLKATLQKVQVNQVVMNEISPLLAEGMGSIVETLVGEHLRADDEGNITVLDKEGKIRYSPSNPGKPMGHKEFIEELQKNHPPMFKPQGITKGSMTQEGGRRSKGSTNNTQGVDVERFRSDINYRNSFSRSQRVKIDRELGD